MTPFAAIAGAPLPAVIRTQLFSTAPVALEGTMDRVWRRFGVLRPLFAALACLDILFPETGADVPCRLEIEPVPDGQAWNRTFCFAGGHRRFDAVLAYDARRCVPVERFGWIELDWDVRFEAPHRLEIRSGRAALRFRGVRVPLPRLLAPDVCAVERALDAETLHVEVVLSHRLLGPLFGYSGTFRLGRA